MLARAARPQAALTNPWSYYAKISAVCFAVSQGQGGRQLAASAWLPPLWPFLPQAPSLGRLPWLPPSQVGAGMELFMIKTGFYEK